MRFAERRQKMVEEQLRRRGIADERVLEVMGKIPREEFVPAGLREVAYFDGPLSIGAGQTISQPYIVALMTQALTLKGGEKVLEVGTGSGYQAAILSKLCAQVFSIEKEEELAGEAGERLKRLGFENVRIKVGDGTEGWVEKSPFEAIVVTAAAPSIPAPLPEQLAKGGRLVIPVGSRFVQELVRMIKKDGRVIKESLGGCRFVPLIGEYGWSS